MVITFTLWPLAITQIRGYMSQWLVQKVLVSKGKKHCDYSFAIKLFRGKWGIFWVPLIYPVLFGLSFVIWVIFWEVQPGKMGRHFFPGVSECWPSLPRPWIKDKVGHDCYGRRRTKVLRKEKYLSSMSVALKL